jgi:hypothetical protein
MFGKKGRGGKMGRGKREWKVRKEQQEGRAVMVWQRQGEDERRSKVDQRTNTT